LTVPAVEKSLPDAIDQLYSAVADLLDPQKELLEGRVMAAPGLYDRLVGEIPAKRGEFGSRFSGRSMPPIWCDAEDLRVQIDGRVRELLPRFQGTTSARLRALASMKFRPQDARRVRDMAAEIGSWCASISALLEPERVKTISAACPVCGARWFYRQIGGEQIRQPALQLVVSQGAECQKCHAQWKPSEYLWLCRLLGFDLPAGVNAVAP